MRVLTLFLASVFIGISLYGLEAPPAINRDFVIEVQPPGLAEKVEFKARKLFNHADFLASDACNGRLAGSPGEAVAREYIVKHLMESGYAEVRRLPFQFTGNVRMGEKNSLRHIYEDGKKHREKEYELITDFKPMPISAAGEGTGSLVFVGYGISAPDKGYDDYAGMDVRGKVVIAFRGEPEKADGTRVGGANDPHSATNVYSDLFYKAGIARDKGALALLLIDGERGKSPEKKIMPDMIRAGGRRHCGFPLIQVLPDVVDGWLQTEFQRIESIAKDPTSNIDKRLPPLLELKNLEGIKKSINEQLKPASLDFMFESVRFSVDIVREKDTDCNLAVVLPGTDPVLKTEIVVIGAHYDHLGTGNEFSLADKSEMGQIHRGADDNASGTSSVLELADALYKNRASLKRTVWILFFGAEEMGTLGSNDFIRNPPPDFDVKNVAAMINLDMVGRGVENKIMVNGMASGVGFEALIKESNAGIGLELKGSSKGLAGSDHLAFEGAGIPVLFFFTGTHQDYHRPSDTADKLDVAEQAKITALAYNAAARIINARERPKFVKVDQPKMTGGMGGIRLGTMPDYGFEGKGLRITGVGNNSPAAKAGLQGGDILIMLGGRKIENINDYMNALTQSKANVATPLKIIRDGKEVELSVVPEKKE